MDDIFSRSFYIFYHIVFYRKQFRFDGGNNHTVRRSFSIRNTVVDLSYKMVNSKKKICLRLLI